MGMRPGDVVVQITHNIPLNNVMEMIPGDVGPPGIDGQKADVMDVEKRVYMGPVSFGLEFTSILLMFLCVFRIQILLFLQG